MRTAAAILGSPVTHSLSPLLHTAAYAALGWEDWEYGAVEVDAESLREALDREHDRIGFSLTMPLKSAIVRIGLARGWRIDPVARAVGVANTLVRGPGIPVVANTDVAGVDYALSDVAWDRVEHIDILGGGATAASALAAAARRGVRRARVHVRDRGRIGAVQAAAEGFDVEVEARSLEAWDPRETRVAISTLPGAAAAPFSAAIREVPEGAVLLEAAYSAEVSPLDAAWTRAGGVRVSGVVMLVGQAIEQFERFAAAAVETQTMPGPLPDDLRARVAAAMSEAVAER